MMSIGLATCALSRQAATRDLVTIPQQIKSLYRDSNRAESLKQAIMMSYDEWGPEGQGINNIESHECAMLTLLRGR